MQLWSDLTYEHRLIQEHGMAWSQLGEWPWKVLVTFIHIDDCGVNDNNSHSNNIWGQQSLSFQWHISQSCWISPLLWLNYIPATYRVYVFQAVRLLFLLAGSWSSVRSSVDERHRLVTETIRIFEKLVCFLRQSIFNNSSHKKGVAAQNDWNENIHYTDRKTLQSLWTTNLFLHLKSLKKEWTLSLMERSNVMWCYLSIEMISDPYLAVTSLSGLFVLQVFSSPCTIGYFQIQDLCDRTLTKGIYATVIYTFCRIADIRR